ncbi:NAD(P)-dependent alcohol dehydrogenase [Gordonia shandongensis]|uniref:NAD(P)-dependent alcohol dehydrogenase n=1 Tax=Gordonia shandongensis TaxID=376351 RepID=UPI00040E3DCF|nr:NAD(P)-dependent alcohol dehydrogenase [Gordonia shandongensis]
MTTEATAAVLRDGGGRFGLEPIVVGPLAPDEILVRVVGVGMCHTDLAIRPGLERIGPAVLGHEGAGVVERTGDAVTGIEVGDHVVLSFEHCGRCVSCRSGHPAYCAEFMLRNLSGRRADGSTGAVDSSGTPLAGRWFGQSSFATHAVATARNAVVVDRGLPLELLGPLGCGLQTGAGAVLNVMRPGPGQSVAVLGAGGVGLAAVMAAAAAGAGDIVAVDLHGARLEVARALGATRTVTADAPDLADRLSDHGGVDFVLDTTAVTSAISTGVGALAPGGTAVLVGAGPGRLEIDPVALAGRAVTYAIEGDAVPQEFIPRLIGLWQDGRFPFESLIETYPLDRINDAESDSASGRTIKPVLLPGH